MHKTWTDQASSADTFQDLLGQSRQHSSLSPPQKSLKAGNKWRAMKISVKFMIQMQNIFLKGQRKSSICVILTIVATSPDSKTIPMAFDLQADSSSY